MKKRLSTQHTKTNTANKKYIGEIGKVLIVYIFFFILTSCASVQIDVDVYKGPLADQTDVQEEQLKSLAVTSKRILEDLQRSLVRDLKSGNNPKFKPMHMSKKPGYSHQNRKGNEGWVIKDIEICKKMLEQEIIDYHQMYAIATLACSLVELSSLFDDMAHPNISAYYQSLISNAYKLKLINQVDPEDMTSQNNGSKFTAMNSNVRKINNGIILDSLHFLSWLQTVAESPDDISNESKKTLIKNTTEIIALLTNPLVLQNNLNKLSKTNSMSKNNSLKLLSLPIIDKEASETAYDEASKVFGEMLSANPTLSYEVLSSLHQINSSELESNTASEDRFKDSGFARGYSVFENVASTDKASIKESYKSYVKFLAKFINSLEKTGKVLSDKDILNQNREPRGIFTLMSLQNETDVGDRKTNKIILEKMLLNYAGKLLELANKQVLVTSKLSSSTKAASKNYVQILQAIGTSIVVQINEIKRKRLHDSENIEWSDFDWSLVKNYYGVDNIKFKNRVLIGLQQDFKHLTAKYKGIEPLRLELEAWIAKEQVSLITLKANLSTFNKKIESIDQAIGAFDVDITQNIPAYLKDKEIARVDYVSQYKTALSVLITRNETILGKPTCVYTDFGTKTGNCSSNRDLEYVFKNAQWIVTTPSSTKTYESHKKEFIEQINIMKAELVKNKNNIQSSINALEEKEKMLQDAIKQKLGSNLLTLAAFTKKSEELSAAIETHENAIKHVTGKILKPNSSVDEWITILTDSTNTKINNIVKQKTNDASKYYVNNVFNCDLRKKSTEQDKSNSKCNSNKALDGLVRHLENLSIHYKTLYADGDERLEHVKQALTSAYDLRARREYLTPISAYLRGSYPASSLQEDSGAENWQNMLFKNTRRSVPLFGEYIFSGSNAVQTQIDKQFWQNINTVRVTGAGKTNYVIVKDDIGNWYVKNYSADAEKVYESLTNAALFNAAGKANSFINTGNGAISLKNSANVLDVMYGRHYETYVTKTSGQFTTIKNWLNNDQWKKGLIALCNDASEKTEFETQISAVETDVVALHNSFKTIEENNIDAQASAISKSIKTVVAYSNQLVTLVGASKCGEENDLAASVHAQVYEGFAEAQLKTRIATVKEFEQKILFISDALPVVEQTKLSIDL